MMLAAVESASEVSPRRRLLHYDPAKLESFREANPHRRRGECRMLVSGRTVALSESENSLPKDAPARYAFIEMLGSKHPAYS
jgi:hypothetical protein